MISKVILHRLRIPMKEEFRTAVSSERVRETLIVELRESRGEVGWGEAVANSSPWYSYETVETEWHLIRDFIAPAVRGREILPETFNELVKKVRGHRMAKAGFEFALWDLKGKLSSKPLKDLIGGVKDKVEVGLSVGVIGDEDLLLKEVMVGLGKGYRRIKLKIKPGWDIRPVSLVRKAFSEVPLQVDANASYQLKHLDILKKLDGYGLLMIEQPLHYEDLLQHSRLQAQLRTPICLDESIRSLLDAEAAYELGSCRIINVKPGRVGGLLETMRIHNFCLKSGIPIWIGGMLETGVGRAYAVAAASLKGVKYPNDISPSERFWEEDIVEPPWILRRDGFIEVPKKPGIGVEVLENVLKRYEIKSQSINLGDP